MNGTPENPLPDSFFVPVKPENEESFRRWAREHTRGSERIKGGLYHPLVRAEWARMGLWPLWRELKCGNCSKWFEPEHNSTADGFESWSPQTEDGEILCADCMYVLCTPCEQCNESVRFEKATHHAADDAIQGYDLCHKCVADPSRKANIPPPD